MKNLLIIFLLSVSFQAYSQVEFAPSGAEWYYGARGSTSFIPPMIRYNKPVNYKYDRDTLINGIDAKVIVITNHYNEIEEEIITQSGDSVLIWWGQEFHLLYDFGAEVGEIIYTEPDSGDEYYLELVEKDTVIINGEELINFTYDVDLGPVVEPIIVNNKFGALDNFLIFNFYTDSDRGYFRCYSDDNFDLFQYGDVACDSVWTKVITGVDDLSTSPDLHIYPNPATHNITIDLSEKGIQRSVKIINSQGQVVLDFHPNHKATEVDVSRLVPGFYSVQLLTENSAFIGKFIKMKE